MAPGKTRDSLPPDPLLRACSGLQLPASQRSGAPSVLAGGSARPSSNILSDFGPRDRLIWQPEEASILASYLIAQRFL
jgi:hypothetical protein